MPTCRRVATRLLPLLLCCVATSAPAQAGPNGVPSTSPVARADAFRDTLTQVERIVRVSLDNDLFAWRDSLIPTDHEYTHGVAADLHLADAPTRVRRWLGGAPGCGAAVERTRGCLMAMIGVRQAIYTPPSNETFAVFGQRPHAGYLGLALGLSEVRRSRLRTLRFDVGTTGTPALGEPVQRFIHEITGSRPELGWRNQLAARLVMAIRVEETWEGALRSAGMHLRARGLYGGQLGSLRTSAFLGSELQLSADRRRFWTPWEGSAALPLGPYLVAGARQEFTAHDLFVDGHLGDVGAPASRESSVWQTAVGIGWRFAGGSSEYRHVHRGKDYSFQQRPHTWGALVFTWYR
jgi:hypothetical protein